MEPEDGFDFDDFDGFDFVEWADENGIETDWDNWAYVEIEFDDEQGMYHATVDAVEGGTEVEFYFSQDDFLISDFLDWLADAYEGWIEYNVDIDS